MKVEQLCERLCCSALQPLTEVSLQLNLSSALKVLNTDWITGVLAFSAALALSLHADSG